jgi:hypothetical protein
VDLAWQHHRLDEWPAAGFGTFGSKFHETDMLSPNSGTGTLEYFDIRHNQVAAIDSLGNLGLNRQGFGVGAM